MMLSDMWSIRTEGKEGKKERKKEKRSFLFNFVIVNVTLIRSQGPLCQ